MVRRLLLVAVLAVPAIASAAPGPQLGIPGLYQNEVGAPLELDYTVLQFPPTLSANPLATTGIVYGQVYDAGVTEAAGAPATILAELGYGAAGSDPRNSLWTWFSTSYNVQSGNNDEYQGTMIAPPLPGTYSYTYRFSQDGGLTYTLADLDGAGANANLVFDPGVLGRLTVVPEPTTLAALGSAALLLRRRR